MNRFLALIALAAVSSAAFATMVATGQLAVPVTIPTSLALGAYESSSQFWVIPEVTGVVLLQSVPGGASGFPTIPAGIRIDVYLIHADPGELSVLLTGTVTFGGAILVSTPVRRRWIVVTPQ